MKLMEIMRKGSDVVTCSSSDFVTDAAKKMKEHKEDAGKMMEIQKEAMEKNIKYMKHTFVPMILTFLPIIIIFGWIKLTYDPFGKIFFMFGWLGTYIIFSIIFSYGLRKALKVY